MLYEIPRLSLQISALYVIFVNTSVAASNNSLCFVGENRLFHVPKDKTVSICETDKTNFLCMVPEEYEMNLSEFGYSSAMFSGSGKVD